METLPAQAPMTITQKYRSIYEDATESTCSDEDVPYAQALVCKVLDSDDEDDSSTVAPSSKLPTPQGATLPSIGSVGHYEGNCSRCCFFPKGRCRNAYNCEFCHLDHEKRRRKKNKKDKDGFDDDTVHVVPSAQQPLSQEAATSLLPPPGLESLCSELSLGTPFNAEPTMVDTPDAAQPRLPSDMRADAMPFSPGNWAPTCAPPVLPPIPGPMPPPSTCPGQFFNFGTEDMELPLQTRPRPDDPPLKVIMERFFCDIVPLDPRVPAKKRPMQVNAKHSADAP